MSPCWLILLFLGQDCMPTPVLGSLLLASLSCSYLPHWSQGLGSAKLLPQHQVGLGQVAGMIARELAKLGEPYCSLLLI